MPRRASRFLKIGLILLWIVAVVGVYWYLHAHQIRIRNLPRLIRGEVLASGWLGPFVIIGLYLASSLLFFSKAAIDVITGTIYGPFWGAVTVLIASNITSAVVFFAGRFFGHHFVQEHERGWIKRYNDLLKEEGFITVLLMRLFLFPFDLVSLGCGISDIPYSHYLLATFLGSLPGTVTFVVLGDAIREPRGWMLFGILLGLSLAAAIALQRSRFGKRMLSKKDPSV